VIKKLGERWANWCGDRDMENAIRRHLTSEGYYGATAKLKNVRLVAVQRPGWVQVYRFECDARRAVTVSDDQPDPPPVHDDLFGLVRDDGRRGCQIRVFREDQQRRSLFETWSDGLICLRGAHGLVAQSKMN
jgi:hypothetical protein